MRKKIISLIMAIVLSASLTLFPACEFIDSTLNNEQSSSQTSEDLSSSESTSSSSENGCEEHTFGEWETVFEPLNCATIGEKQRICTKCNDVESEEILPAFSQHTFNENTLCTTCGHQEFIESEEYIEEIEDGLHSHFIWWNIDRTYALKIGNYGWLSDFDIEGYVGTPIEVVLPTKYNHSPIKYVGGTLGASTDSPAYAFKGCTTLETIIIPEGITEINSSAFESCASLKEIILPNSLIRIGANSFYNCLSLTEIYIPKNVTAPFDPFDNCPSLLKIYAHKDCTIDKEEYFNHHPNLEIIRYE